MAEALANKEDIKKIELNGQLSTILWCPHVNYVMVEIFIKDDLDSNYLSLGRVVYNVFFCLLVIGNAFGEDGIELLRESLEAKGLADALGSLSDDEGLESEEEEEGEGEESEQDSRGEDADESREELSEESSVPEANRDVPPPQKTVSCVYDHTQCCSLLAPMPNLGIRWVGPGKEREGLP